MQNVCLNVEGMHCTGCENRLKNALLGLDGVINAEADFSAKTVVVDFKNPADIHLIEQKIDDLGFKVVK